jgi:phosphatidate cytidylyltransferase
VSLVVALAAHEWARLSRLAGSGAVAYAALFAAGFFATTPVAGLLPHGNLWVDAVFACAALFWIAVAPAWMRRGLAGSPRAVLAVAGVAVLFPAAHAVLALGRFQLLLVLALVWIADSAAYFAGRRFGRRKLAPAISPGKTVEGAIGALAGAGLYAMICTVLVPGWKSLPAFPQSTLFVAGAIVLCVISIVGDLFESAAKRQAGVKDSGALLPGHGGVLDRIDSATAVLPVAALMLRMGSLSA